MSCQSSCQSCQGCNKCQKCNTGCNIDCNTSQSFCNIGKQEVGSFSFDACLAADETIAITKTKWNALYKYIYNAYHKGSESNMSGSCKIGSSSSDTYLTASGYNEVAKALSGLGSSGVSRRVSVGDLIYGSYYQELEDAADGLLYDESQCNTCDSKCQGCNVCQSCNDGCNVTCDSAQGTCCDHTADTGTSS